MAMNNYDNVVDDGVDTLDIFNYRPFIPYPFQSSLMNLALFFSRQKKLPACQQERRSNKNSQDKIKDELTTNDLNLFFYPV